MALCSNAPYDVAFRKRYNVGTGNLIYISWLNGWPVNTPVNASPHASRYTTHDSGTLWIAGPSMVGDFHLGTGLRRTLYI
jgi:putative salt-induced outer membrane protein YdiY